MITTRSFVERQSEAEIHMDSFPPQKIEVCTSQCPQQSTRLEQAVIKRLHWDVASNLSADLCCDIVVRKTSSREERDLLPSRNGVHHVNGGDASLQGIAQTVSKRIR